MDVILGAIAVGAIIFALIRYFAKQYKIIQMRNDMLTLISNATEGIGSDGWAYNDRVYNFLETLTHEITDKKQYGIFYEVLTSKSLPLIHDEQLNQRIIIVAKTWGKSKGLL